ncbi:MAG TPA: YihY/virulence factor BrkB family protein [Phnomibacter sp.]|nr:YihY/virulence factor BrkB family protein [Phnomibacter sp.]
MKRIKQRIWAWGPVAWMLRISKRLVLPGFDGIPLYDILVFFVKQVRNVGISERAAAISFNFIMAIPAGLIFLLALVPFLPKSVHFEEQLLLTLKDILQNADTYELVANVVKDFFATHSRGLISFSLIFIIFFSSNAMMGIMHTFDRSYFEERSRRFMAKRWMALKLTTLLVLLIIASVLIMATQGTIKTFVLNKLGWHQPWIRSLIEYSRWLVIFGLAYFSIAFIYKYGPAVKVRWSLWSPGAVLATLLVILTSWLFSVWVDNFASYNKIYGSIGTVIIIMNLIYINSLILIVGFEINVGITSIRRQSLARLNAEG